MVLIIILSMKTVFAKLLLLLLLLMFFSRCRLTKLYLKRFAPFKVHLRPRLRVCRRTRDFRKTPFVTRPRAVRWDRRQTLVGFRGPRKRAATPRGVSFCVITVRRRVVVEHNIIRA